VVLAERRARIEALGFDYESQRLAPIERCNLCGNDRFVTLSHRDRYDFPARTSACLRCGLAFLDPRMTAEGYGEFYEHTYRPLVSAFHGRRIDAETVEREQEAYAGELAPLLAPFLAEQAGARLLDVGGSTGVVAAALARPHDIRPVVLDPAPAEVDRARDRGIEGFVGTIESFDAGDDRFGVVLLCQTIDHLLDVAGSLDKLRALMEEDGLLFVDIVDFRAAYLRAGNVEHATKIDHPYSLTEATAEAFLARAGFDVVRKDYAADHLHVGYVCRPVAPDPELLPSRDQVEQFFAEARFVQNARRLG
jgi:SAM-dependent methyltransferase